MGAVARHQVRDPQNLADLSNVGKRSAPAAVAGCPAHFTVASNTKASVVLAGNVAAEAVTMPPDSLMPVPATRLGEVLAQLVPLANEPGTKVTLGGSGSLIAALLIVAGPLLVSRMQY